MLEKLLKAKHWQLFVIVFAVPFVMHIVFMALLFTSLEPGVRQTGFPDAFRYLPFFFIFYLVAMVVLFSWYYALVVKLDAKIPVPLKLNLKRFKFFFFFPLVYILILLSFIALFFIGSVHQPSPGTMLPFIFLVIPLHLFSMFCIGHTFYFVGKSIKLAETQRAVKFEDFVGEFFLAWFYLVGFWIIQPKVNRIWANEIPTATDTDAELI